MSDLGRPGSEPSRRGGGPAPRTGGPVAPPPRPISGPSPALLGGVAAILVALVVALLWVLGVFDGAPPESITATPVPTTPEPTTDEPTPTVEPTPTPPEPTVEPTAGDPNPAEPTPGDREPTDADAAAFSTRYLPPGGDAVETVTVDLDADGRAEVVFLSLAQGRVRLDIAAWDGRAYQVVYVDQGGQADAILEIYASDFTGSGTREVATLQTFGADGQSLSVWGWDGRRYVAQRANGGCWNGSHTYGIVGATITPGEIRATCDGSPLPRATWPTDVYRWDGSAWTYERTVLA
jgi:hypothetical protein